MRTSSKSSVWLGSFYFGAAGGLTILAMTINLVSQAASSIDHLHNIPESQ